MQMPALPGRFSLPIGIELSESHIRALQYERAGRGFRVRAKLRLPVPSAEARGETLLDALRRIKTGGFVGRNVVLSLPSDETLVRPLKLPDGVEPADQRFEQAFLSEARNSLPYDLNDAVLDYIDLGAGSNGSAGQHALLLVAVKRAHVVRYVDIIRDAGFKCLQIDLASAAAARVCQDRKEPYVLVDLDENQTVISIAQGPRLLFSRVLKIGIDTMVDAVAQALQLPEAQAHAILEHYGFSTELPRPIPVGEIMETGTLPAREIPAILSEICVRELEFLVREIDRTFRYFLLQPCGCMPSSGVMFGDWLPPALLEFVSSRLHLKLSLPTGTVAPVDAAYIKAAGLALRGAV